MSIALSSVRGFASRGRTTLAAAAVSLELNLENE